MKTLRRFYIVDVTAESVVGGFDAPNFSMASRISCNTIKNSSHFDLKKKTVAPKCSATENINLSTTGDFKEDPPERRVPRLSRSKS